MNCDWQYETNLPLECFLNGSQPDVGTSWVGWLYAAVWFFPPAFIAISFAIHCIEEFMEKRRAERDRP